MVLKKLCESLKRWRAEGNIGGLRRLKVPTRTSDDPFRASEEFFGNVMTNCPQVEYLDGYKMSLFTSNRLTCKDTWLLKLGEWEKFNATCKNLREFHWVVVPFRDPYFRVFGEHIKPRLKKLSFGVSMDWDWRWYFYDTTEAAGKIPDDVEQQSYCERPSYGVLATNVSAALKGCPALDEVLIQLYHPVGASDVLLGRNSEEVHAFPTHEAINVDVTISARS
ncbi:hypothetical protein PHYPSEUDO_011127 [Phytophthora pseudosyringae]|uniref:Uncharacterized protein n=1 Tax=Phytophthora pseudosyringae TaxID=221518 RepID=A0A8T1VBR0_9STRA|nr:hypothetical protein PHYPSEUDO_011127 [Phytophthora pseudosyringae]